MVLIAFNVQKVLSGFRIHLAEILLFIYSLNLFIYHKENIYFIPLSNFCPYYASQNFKNIRSLM